MYKALITDVDGTLIVNSVNGLPTPRVKEAIKKAQKVAHIGIATSRPMFMLDDLFASVEFSGPCIVAGGAQIYDASTKKITYNQAIETDDFWKVIDILKPHAKEILINEANLGDITLKKDYVPDMPLDICIKALDDKVADKLVSEVSNIPGVNVHKLSSHTPGKADMAATHALATKQHGILQVAELLKIDPKEIIGVGDGYNDFPLLMACGLRIAMGNAVDELKAIADFVAPSVEEDGLAVVIEKFLLKQ